MGGELRTFKRPPRVDGKSGTSIAERGTTHDQSAACKLILAACARAVVQGSCPETGPHGNRSRGECGACAQFYNEADASCREEVRPLLWNVMEFPRAGVGLYQDRPVGSIELRGSLPAYP